jgi:hypothetical protein
MASAPESGESPEADGGQTGQESENQNCVETSPGRLHAEHGNAHADPSGEENRQEEQNGGGNTFEQFHCNRFTDRRAAMKERMALE